MRDSMTVPQALLDELIPILGAGNVLSDPSEILVYESDGSTMHNVQPGGVVYPRGTEQIAAVVTACARAGVPFVARGAGTGLSGGAMALGDGIIVALNRMNRILSVDPANRRAEVEPGVTNLSITKEAAPHGLYFAPDPSSQSVCTIGGNIAHNSGGPHTLKHGVTVNHLIALEFVLPDGRVVEIGGPERPGYDLAALVTGSEGTFGIVSRATVKLTRRAEGVRTLLAAFVSPRDASRAVSGIIAAGVIPAALEMMDSVVVEALTAAFGFRFPPGAEALLLIECDGPEAGLDEEADAVAEVSRSCGALSVRLASDDAERADVWRARKKAFGALGRLARNYSTQDGVVPRTKIPEMLDRITEIAARHGVRVANVFHAGDGNLHPCILFDDRSAEERRRVLAAGAEILTACVEVGGSLTGEHGVGIEKRERMGLIFSEPDLALMRRLKQAFDPAGVCNPGKIIPLGAPCIELPPRLRQAAL